MYQDIQYLVEDPVATIVMNRPSKLNALTPHMLAEIRHALAAAERDERAVGIVLTGAGAGFCAGMDVQALKAMTEGGRSQENLSDLAAEPGDPEMGEDFRLSYAYLLSIRKPVIAAVNGACAGLGFCLALLCDMRFADRNARFTSSFSQRGLVAEHGTSWILPRLVGPARALDLLWSARKLDGAEAQRLGLADRLCEPGTALEEAKSYIRDLAKSASPTSLMVMKRQVYRHLMMPLGEAMRETRGLMDESFKRADFREGVRSFVEKRPPRFSRLRVEDDVLPPQSE